MSHVSSNSNQSITIIIYLFSFVEIKNFSQIFLKVVGRQSPPFYKFFEKSLKNIHTRISFLFTAPLDHASKIRPRSGLKDHLVVIVIH